MIEIRQTETFEERLDGLRAFQTIARIVVRLRSLSLGNPGDVRPVSGGISEPRIDHGPGYCVDFVRSGSAIIVLLCGGD